jgi:predicted negative regulator of RcsB-dependent stress response
VEDLSDIEREEQLRRWWSDNWAWIIGSVALGLALLAGWQYWQRHRLQSAEQDQASYRAVIDALGGNKRDEAAKLATELRDRRPASPYADQSELALARAAVDRREYDEAARLLKSVADHSKDPELRLVARTRLARVLIEQGKHDEALAGLDPSQAGAFGALVHEIRGDAYAAKGDATAARGEYEAALRSGGAESGLDRELVELKRDASGAASTGTAAAGTPAASDTAAPAPAAAPTSATQSALPVTSAPSEGTEAPANGAEATAPTPAADPAGAR